MKLVIGRALIGLGLLLASLYLGDYAAIRFRIWRNITPFRQITVQPYYAIHEKNNKTEYDSAPAEIDTCINALFPHLGYNPCWYLNRHRERAIDI